MSYLKSGLILSLIVFRSYLSFNGIISDCDETFNYWEPLNLLARGFGKQTWEYSPEYSIRSWVFLIPLSLVSRILRLFTNKGIVLFYAARFLIAAFTVLSEITLFQSLNRINAKISYWFLFFSAISPGMSLASISLLPSSFAMNCIGLTQGFVLEYLQTGNLAVCYNIIFWISVAGLTGWPFVLVLVAPILVYILFNTSNKKILIQFIFGSAFIASVVLGFITYVDSTLYSKLTIVPLNAVLYNVFNSDEATGPNIFGVEPLSYYVLNLLLNFNVVAVLGYAGLIIVSLVNLISGANDFSVFSQNSKFITLLSPLLIWSVIFGLQPHKEERFLYPVYPFILISAAALTETLFALLKMLFVNTTRYKKIGRFLHHLAIIGVVILVGSVSLLRSASLIQNYSAPLRVYYHLPKPQTTEISNVCVGREWYHFPTSFFLDDNQRLKFTRSGFNGILPGDFKESPDIFDSISAIPANMNNKNLFEEDKVIPFEDCDYYIDIDKEVDVEAGEVAVFQRTGEIDDNWDLVYCDKFIDVDQSYGVGRLLYVPQSLHERLNTHVEYFNYCLAKRK